jgi:hypothetical protein
MCRLAQELLMLNYRSVADSWVNNVSGVEGGKGRVREATRLRIWNQVKMLIDVCSYG